MTRPHRVELGSLLIDGGEGTDGVYLTALSGWDDLAEGRGSPDSIPGAHGSFPRVDVWRDSKAPTVTGAIQASTRARAEEYRAKVSAAAAVAVSMTVTDETGRWTSAAEIESVDFQDMGAWSSYIPFTIDVLVTDPVRYRDPVTVGPVGLPVQVGGLILPAAPPWDLGTAVFPVASVVNDGSVPILPRVTVTGSADGVTVFGGPRRLEFGPFSGTFVMDARERRAWLNGVDVTRQLLRRDWPTVPAGVSHDFYFDAVDASPETALSVDYRIGAM